MALYAGMIGVGYVIGLLYGNPPDNVSIKNANLHDISSQCRDKFITIYNHQQQNDWIYFGVHIGSFSPVFIHCSKNEQTDIGNVFFRGNNLSKQSIVVWLKKNFNTN